MLSIAAERIWYAVSPDGKGDDLILRVSVPVENSDMGWGCTVDLGILEQPSHTIYGSDSWQALQLSMQFVARRLSHFSKCGWKFYWEKDEEPAEVEELFYVPKTF